MAPICLSRSCGFSFLVMPGNDDGILFAGTLWPFLYLFR